MEAVCKFLPVAVFILNCVIIELECAIVFTHVASDTIVVQGKSLTLPCSAVNTGSHGDIQRQWTRDGVPVTIGSRIHLFQNGSLYISQTLPGDEGEYVCIASIIGQQGSNVETIPANVYFAFIDPVFYHPASQTVTDGEQYTHLQCVSGDSRPPVEINWEKDGVPFTEGTSYQTIFGNVESIKQSGTLQINNIREELAGHFRCVTVNPLLRDQPEYSNYATLTVNPREGPPYVVLSPSNITVGVGSPASMECQIIGTPTPTISWIKLGEIGAIINSPARYVQDNTLYITSVDDGDAGVYICTGSNSEGSISADPAYLIVASMGTSFLQQPSDTLAVLGTAVTLICRPPVSNPPSVVTWYKDNAIIRESSQKIISDNGDLYMPSVILSDAGVYFCAATNSYIPRTLTSTTATLSIQVGALITIPPSNAQAVIHDRVMFTCTADGDPKPEIKWYKQQELIDDDYYDSRYSIGFDGESLTITDVIYNDQGTYVCEASNGVNVDRASAFLDVIVPPQIDVGPPSDLTARVGSAVLVNCEVLGDPTPTVSWFKDEFPLIWSAENTRYISTPQGLQIMNVVTSDAGVYRCHAENEAGIAEESGVLRVEDVPVITQGPLSQTVNEGHPLTMTCQASAFPEPSYSWLYNDGEMLPPQAIVSQDGRQLSIPQTEDDNSGTYTCRVDNLHGYDKATATLFVRVVPSVNPLEDVLIEQGETLLMTCNAQGKPEPSIQWLKGDDSITPDTRLTLPTHNTLQISPVLASDEGEYHCIAHNPAGSGRTTFQLTVSGLTTALPVSPVTIKAPHLTSTSSIAQPQTSRTDSLMHSVKATERQSTQVPTISTPDKPPKATYQTYESTPKPPIVESSSTPHSSIQGTSTFPFTTETFFTLSVTVKATAPLVMSATAVSTSEVILTWIPGTITETILYYVIQYAQRYSSDWLTYPNTAPYVGGTETYRVSGLQSNTEYIFQVLAMNQYGLSQPSNQMAASTLSDRIGPSPPRNLQVIGVNSTSIHLQWEIPEERDSDIVAYEIQFIQTDLIGGGTLEIESTGVYISTAVISNLLTFTTYRLRVRAASFYDGGIRQWGNYSEYVQTQTLHGAPLNSPTLVTAVTMSSTSIHVTWQEPAEDNQSGAITRYDVLLIEADTGEETMIVTSGDTYETIVTELKPWRAYDISVRAHNTEGPGPYTEPVFTTTLAGVPTAAPINVMVFPIDGLPTQLRVTWEEVAAEHKNGVVDGYLMIYHKSDSSPSTALMVDIPDGDQFEINITDLSPHTEYNVKLLAYNIVNGQNSGGPFSDDVTGKTTEGLPGPVKDVVVIRGFTYLLLIWQPPSIADRNGIIIGYTIKYIMVIDTQDPDVSDFDDIGVDFRNSSHGAVITASPPYNLTGLIPDTTYIVSITASTSAGMGMQPVVKRTDTTSGVSPTSIPSETTAKNDNSAGASSGITADWWTIPKKDMPVFIGAMVAIALSCLGVLLFGCWYCRHKKKKSKTRQAYLIPPANRGQKNKKKRHSRTRGGGGGGGGGNNRKVELEETAGHSNNRTIATSDALSRDGADGRSEKTITVLDAEKDKTVLNGGSVSGTNISSAATMRVKRIENNSESPRRDGDGMTTNSDAELGRMTKYNSPMHDISYDSMDELKLHFDDNQSRDSLSNKFDLNTFTTNSENVTPRDLVTSGLISHDGFSSPTPEELDGLYAKVNFSKKKMNQRRDDAILNNSDSVSIYGFNNPMVAMTLNERTEL